MHRICKEIDFCYGHRLRDYGGKCKHLHGHNGRLEITFVAEELDERGMVLDFSDAKRIVKGWVDEHMDHKMLLRRDDPILPYFEHSGEPFYLMDENPTAENIAKEIYRHIVGEGWRVEKVKLWETPNSWAEYGE